MSIIQPDRQEGALPLLVTGLPTSSPDVTPPPSSGQRIGDRVAITLSSLLLIFGVLLILTKGPLNAPPFALLTQYVCDPLPPLPTLGNRFQQSGLRLTCRAGNQLIYQRESVSNVSNQSQFLSCGRIGGLTKIWRMAPSGAYGEIVFHATCGDQIVISYNNSAAKYELNQYFITALACAMIIIGAVWLFVTWLRRGPGVCNLPGESS